MEEPSFAVFGGVVFQGEAKAGKSWRQGPAMGASQGRGDEFADTKQILGIYTEKWQCSL